MTTQKEIHSEPNTQLGGLPGGPGLRLQEARVKAGLSVDEVAAHLRLRVSVIEALEDNQFSEMAGLVFVRGYLRAYARALHIDADEIVGMFNELNFKEEAPVANGLQSRQPTQRGERPVRWLIVVILFSVSVLSLLWWNAARQSKKASYHAAINPTQKASTDLVALDDLSTMKKPQEITALPKSPLQATLKNKRTKG